MEQRKLLLAIVVSVVILIGFQYLFEKMRPPTPATPPSPAATQTAPAPGTTSPGATAPAATGAAGQASGTAVAPAAETREQAIAEQPRVRINTPRLHGSVALTGGRLDDLTLATYHETVDPKSPEVVLLWPKGTKDPYFAEFGWVPGTPGAKVPRPDTQWTASGGPLAPNSPMTLTWDNGAGLVFTRTISVDENYMFTVRDAVKNSGSTPVSLLPYALISRTGSPQVGGYYILHEGLIGELGGSLREVKYSSLDPGKPTDYNSTGGWLGFTDKYWLTALIPPEDGTVKARFTHVVESGVDRYQSDYLGSQITVPADGTAATSARFFAGAKEVNLLDAYAASGIPHFDLAIDFGWFYFLTKPIFKALQFFYDMLGNFGLAILLLPFDPPATIAHFVAIGAWPLLMGVTMYLQQKLNPQPVDPVQARMFMLLPIVFTYMLSAFPAGLVIYWAWNKLLSIAQQWAI